VSYKLTKKAEADLSALIDFSLARFGSETALRHLAKLERSIEALDRGDFEGPELTIASRARPVQRWPVPPHWIY
jgi:plasmid stabilization system protein ParE